MLLFVFAAATALLIKPMITLLADIMATAIAAWHFWRSDRFRREILEIGRKSRTCYGWEERAPDRALRRLLARDMRNATRMTMHFSQYPSASLSGYALAQAMRARF